MLKLIKVLLFCTVSILAVNADEATYKEKYRLQIHYSVPTKWSNDPNGLIYFNGYYHFFYQYNPHDVKMGTEISWGHARTKDLIHWENLDIAMEPFDQGSIFSGCIVLDKDNVTDFSPNSNEDHTDIPMVALYSLVKGNNQSQGMAYSFDNGTIWKQYHANPVINNPGLSNFRDPNVFEVNGKYFMTLAVKNRVSFHTSTDLKSWKFLDDFGINPNEGDDSGVWECPSLVTLKDEKTNQHDVLFVSENSEKKGSLFQYFIGKFNGSRFNSYNTSKMFWAEDAIDNYAAVPYHNDPMGRVILIGWMSNWLYADKIPTSTWRGQYTIPRELGITLIEDDLYLTQRPVEELNKLINQTWSMSAPFNINTNQMNLSEKIPFKTGSLLKLQYSFDIGHLTNGKCGFRFGNNLDEFVSFAFDVETKMYEFDRMHSGNVSFHEKFANKVMKSDRISPNDTLSGIIILDVASIEIFADDGLNVFTAIFFPTKIFENIELINTINGGDGRSLRVESLSVSSLNSIWSN